MDASPLTKPPPTLRALMEEMIDYAGLFPPAKLSLEEAVRNFTEYRNYPQSWMLARFICATSLFKDFKPLAASTPCNEAWRISAIGRGGDDAASLLDGLRLDVAEIAALSRESEVDVRVDAIEVKLPSPVSINVESVELTLAEACLILDSAVPYPITPYFEVAFGSQWPTTVEQVIEAIANVREGWKLQHCQPPCLKIRTGGIRAELFPTVEQLAFWIRCCHRLAVPFKATAGLHHPVRHYSADVQTDMHGFFNLFFASAAASCGQDGLIEPILEETSADAFTFGSSEAEWNDMRVSLDTIRGVRCRGFRAFGSCSFLEPVEDLRTLGWL